MRTLSLLLVTLFALTSTSSEAIAAHAGKPHAGKPHVGNAGKPHAGKHHAQAGKPTPQPTPHVPPPLVKVRGAGQRLNFSFGGTVTFTGGKGWGEFAVVSHPVAPAGATLSVACRYHTFRAPSVQGNTFAFEAEGSCRTLSTNGEFANFEAVNRIQIIDNPDGDAIDMNFVGNAGIAITGGSLSFGNFEILTGNS